MDFRDKMKFLNINLIILSIILLLSCESNKRSFGEFIDDTECISDSHCKTGFICGKDNYCRKDCDRGYQDNNHDGVCELSCINARSELFCYGTKSICDDSTGKIECKCNKGYQDNDNDGTCEPDCETANLSCESSGRFCSDSSGIAECECRGNKVYYNNVCVNQCNGISCIVSCNNGMCKVSGNGLSSFKIDEYEVTVSLFKLCVNAGKCSRDNFGTGGIYDNYDVSGRDNHPMNSVNWYGAKEYCEWAGKRLPTEAEWVYAAYGSDGRDYPWGNEEPNCDYAVYDNGSDGCGENHTWPVGSKSDGKSPFGLYDMAGNVYEWVEDCYDNTCVSRVLRGGEWFNVPYYLRSSSRGNGKPDSVGNGRGFRCVK